MIGFQLAPSRRSPCPRPARPEARHSATGRSLHPGRAAHDFYPTPPEAVRALLSVESFEGSIWEPACGDGAISRTLVEAAAARSRSAASASSKRAPVISPSLASALATDRLRLTSACAFTAAPGVVMMAVLMAMFSAQPCIGWHRA
jgi:hypothetical protein